MARARKENTSVTEGVLIDPLVDAHVYLDSQRPFMLDFGLTFKKGYVICEYMPLGIKAEGANEREARDALMLQMWVYMARRTEEKLKKLDRTFSIKNMMNEIEGDYASKHPQQEILVSQERKAIIPIDVVMVVSDRDEEVDWDNV